VLILKTIVVGIDGIGIKKRLNSEENTFFNSVEGSLISEIEEKLSGNLKEKIVLYVNGLVGIRIYERNLFYYICKNFEKVCIVIDRKEQLSLDDLQVITNDISEKLNFPKESIYSIAITEKIDDLKLSDNNFMKTKDITINYVPRENIIEIPEKSKEIPQPSWKKFGLPISVGIIVITTLWLIFRRNSKVETKFDKFLKSLRTFAIPFLLKSVFGAMLGPILAPFIVFLPDGIGYIVTDVFSG